MGHASLVVMRKQNLHPPTRQTGYFRFQIACESRLKLRSSQMVVKLKHQNQARDI